MDVRDIMEAGGRTAVVPLGACEQHGPHLPMGTDTYFVYEASRRGAALAAAQEGAPVALVFPPLWYSSGYQWAAGEIWLRPSTIIAVLVDVVRQLERTGFRRIVLTTGHGDNPGIMFDALREAHHLGVEAELFSVPSGAFMGAAKRQVAETTKFGHACEMETSRALYLFGDRVHMDRVSPGPEQPLFWKDLSPYAAVRNSEVRQPGFRPGTIGERPGYAGDPTKGSVAKGERQVEAYAEGFAAFLRDLHAGGTR